MAPATFSLFLSLPLELRQEIYKLATPPRIVDLQEEPEDWDEFRERLLVTCPRLKLDPSLTHFAFNWRKRIPFRSRQPTLEAFGFNTPPPSRPWTPSIWTPEIPLNWLADHPEVAWELTREGELYSRATIPALLHTCSESRSILMRWGYQLAFRTRSSGPQTWFHFDRDILFLEHHLGYDGPHADEYSGLLSGGPWDVGQFDPRDLRRVRRLALESSARELDLRDVRSDDDRVREPELSALLQVFGGLQELLLVEWTGRDIDGEHDRPSSDPFGPPFGSGECQEAPLCCIAVDELDALLSLFNSGKWWRGQVSMAGEHGTAIKSYKQENGLSAQFFKDMQLVVTERLNRDRDALLATKNNGPVTRWEIPEVTAVHIMSQSKLQILWRKRLSIMGEICDLKLKRATDARRRDVSDMLAPKSRVDEGIFAAIQAQEEALSHWFSEEEVLAQLQREDDELADWQEEDPAGEQHDEDTDSATWSEDEEAYAEAHNSPEQMWASEEREEREWWVREGWWDLSTKLNSWFALNLESDLQIRQDWLDLIRKLRAWLVVNLELDSQYLLNRDTPT